MNRKNFAGSVFCPVVCLSLFLASGSLMAETGTVKSNKIDFAQNTAIEDTTSTTSTTVPGMEITFKEPKSALVRFCANGNMFGTGTGAIQVTATVDDDSIGDDIQFFTNEDFAVKPRCYEWATPVLGRGSHTARISWRLTLGGGAALTGRFHDSILTVHHR